ncbi:MAG: ATP cone domain-containing protein [Methanobacteriota archaeon]
MKVVKADGNIEEFKPQKIMRTLRRSGASGATANKILNEIIDTSYDGITTKEILKRVKTLLQKEEPQAAMRYDLKGAIMRLGPSGYPFETFVAKILEHYGYKTKLRTIVEGRFLRHEIDIIAERMNGAAVRCMMECKFRNLPGTSVDTKDVLYTYARFLDLNEGNARGKGFRFDEVWVVSNARISSQAIRYANGKGMKLLCWRCHGGTSLEKMIEAKGLYPVTILRSVDRETLEKLFAANLILAKDLLLHDISLLKKKTGLKEEKLRKLISETRRLLAHRLTPSNFAGEFK